jgi:recombination protein RecA
MELAEKQSRMAEIASIINKKGKGKLLKMLTREEAEAEKRYDVISTGSMGLDLVTGIGGIPKGRITEIFGPESSGKTTIGLHAIANVNRAGGMAVFIDAEHAFDEKYASDLGCDIDNGLCYVLDATYAEETLEYIDTIIRSNTVELIVLDSIASLIPKAELEGTMEDNQIALLPRIISKYCKKITGSLDSAQVACVFINQTRENASGYGKKEVTPGGRALKFYTSMRIRVKESDLIGDKDSPTGNRIVADIIKNKCAKPHGKTQYDIIYGTGISKVGEIVDYGVAAGIIVKSTSWYTMGDVKLQGREKMVQYMIDNPEVADETEKTTRKILGM